jgi:nicotinamidase-related amidase
MPYQVQTINPDTAVLLVIDMQNDFVAPGAPMEKAAARAIVPILEKAIQFAAELEFELPIRRTPTVATAVIWAYLTSYGSPSPIAAR